MTYGYSSVLTVEAQRFRAPSAWRGAAALRQGMLVECETTWAERRWIAEFAITYWSEPRRSADSIGPWRAMCTVAGRLAPARDPGKTLRISMQIGSGGCS